VSALRAGYGEATITPPLGTDLTGFGFYLDRKAEIVLDDLKVRALFLDDRKTRLLIISCDLIGLSVARSDRLRRRVAAALGLPEQNILLSCTHTHSGPATESFPGLGRVDRNYLRRLPEAVAEASRAAAASAEEAEFGFDVEAVEPIGFNRRRKNFIEIDPWLKVGVVRQKDRRLFLLNYACHAVTLGPSKEVSADFPGALGRELESGGDRCLFLQGFCGDIDPVVYLNRRLGRRPPTSTSTASPRLEGAQGGGQDAFRAGAPLLAAEKRIVSASCL
jgi:hypothetical protein